jgi:hypothetical protein
LQSFIVEGKQRKRRQQNTQLYLFWYMQSPNQHQNKKLKTYHETSEMSIESNLSSLDEKTLNRFSRQNAALGKFFLGIR